jgi:hypothetical protein
MTVNQDIRDDLISHDIDLRKVDADSRKKIEVILGNMEADLKVLTVKIDPFTPTSMGIREARFKRLENESTEIVSEAYKEIAKLMRKRGQRAVVAESQKIVDAIHNNIPVS